jgi:hypothetical protein
MCKVQSGVNQILLPRAPLHSLWHSLSKEWCFGEIHSLLYSQGLVATAYATEASAALATGAPRVSVSDAA